jgi:hypothetical protein
MTKIATSAFLAPHGSSCESLSAHAQPAEIFSIGSKDGLFIELERKPEAGRMVLYKAGESSLERDWPAYQPGSFVPEL